MKKSNFIILIIALVVLVAGLSVLVILKGEKEDKPQKSDELIAAEEVFRIELNATKDAYFIKGLKTNANVSGANIVIPDSVDGIPVTKIIDRDNNFASFNNIATITLGKNINFIGKNGYTSNEDKIYGEDIFSAATSLVSIHVNEENSVFSSDNGILFNKDKTVLIKYPAGKAMGLNQAIHAYKVPDGVTTIYHNAFKYNKTIESISLGKDVQVIEKEAFSGCVNLHKITLNEGLTEICEATFENCLNLDSIVFPSTVTIIRGRAFKGCSILNNVTITSNIEFLGLNIFSGCNDLKSIFVTPEYYDNLCDKIIENEENLLLNKVKNA